VGNAFQAQMPAYAEALGTDQAGLAYSALLAANAAGAVLGGVLLEATGLLRARPRTAMICAAVWCVLITGFAASQTYPIAFLLLFLAGIVNLAFSSMSQTLVQVLAPSEIRGRVIGLYNMASQGMRLGSGFTVGVMGSVVGVHMSLGLSATVLLLITLVLFAYTVRSGSTPSPTIAREPSTSS
jgi:MFS family permease